MNSIIQSFSFHIISYKPIKNISSVSSMLNFEWHPYQVGHVKATFHIQLPCCGFCNARFKAWGLGFENVDLFEICAQSFELVNLLTQR